MVMEVRKKLHIRAGKGVQGYTVDCHKDKEFIYKNSYKECCAMAGNMLWNSNTELPVLWKEESQASKKYHSRILSTMHLSP